VFALAEGLHSLAVTDKIKNKILKTCRDGVSNLLNFGKLESWKLATHSPHGLVKKDSILRHSLSLLLFFMALDVVRLKKSKLN
jgi:hypothetical protein